MATLNQSDNYFLLYKSNHESPIGYITLQNFHPTLNRCDLIFFIDSKFEKLGYCTLMIREIIIICFEKLNLEKIIAKVIPSNKAAKNILEKVNFLKEATFCNEILTYKNELKDIELYGLISEDFDIDFDNSPNKTFSI
nr:GNAT family protein [Aquimarina longa]